MTIKEKEEQLKFDLSIYILACVILWLGLAVYGAISLWRLRKVPSLPLTAVVVNVPDLRTGNLEALRKSIRPEKPASLNLPVVRAEPFD